MIDGALSKQRAIKEHFRALHYKEVTGALDTVVESGASQAAKLALWFLILTAVRTGEILGTTWDEIDVDNRIWTIPAARMNNDPGTPRALARCRAGRPGTGAYTG